MAETGGKEGCTAGKDGQVGARAPRMGLGGGCRAAGPAADGNNVGKTSSSGWEVIGDGCRLLGSVVRGYRAQAGKSRAAGAAAAGRWGASRGH